jgi:lantibiotic modifying enzyme
MASIRNLKKDINNVLGDLIDAVYIVEATNGNEVSKEGEKIIDSAIGTFDELIAKVNQRDVADRKAHLKKVREELESSAKALVDKVNKLA